MGASHPHLTTVPRHNNSLTTTASPQQSLATHGHSLAPELIVADVDRGELRPCTAGATSFPTSVAALKDAAPPAAALAKRLAAVVGPEKFDEVEVQAACLRFVADVLNVHNGCLSDSQEAPRSAEIGRDRPRSLPHPRMPLAQHAGDVVAMQKWNHLLAFEEARTRRIG